jgi:hypothetical protein
MKNIKYQKYLEGLDKKLVEAIGERDAVDYFLRCNELGVEPELLDLYEQGQVEINNLKINQGKLEKLTFDRSIKKRKRTVPNIRYKNFYEEASFLSLDLGKDTDSKKELLIKYFPGRFGDKGRNPVQNMDFLNVGSLFKKIIYYTENRIKQ